MTSRATRKLWCTLYWLHWVVEGQGHRIHPVSGTQELSMCVWRLWPFPSLPEHSKIPVPILKVFCSLPKWSPMLSSDALEAQVSTADWATGAQVVLWGYKEQSGSTVWAGAHPVSPSFYQNQAGGQTGFTSHKQLLTVNTQFTLFLCHSEPRTRCL